MFVFNSVQTAELGKVFNLIAGFIFFGFREVKFVGDMLDPVGKFFISVSIQREMQFIFRCTKTQ